MNAKPGAHEIRRRFLRYFEGKQHAVVPSSSLVPENDATLLFTNAGMVQFKDVFLGREQRPYTRAVTVQRCLRAGGKHNDLDNVGFTPRHQTLFEMLGNFSFGDYFKQEAIAYAWEFLTEGLQIPAERMVVSIYNGEGEAAPRDDEAYALWAELIPRDRIYAFNAKENFWMMGDTGPCGPCSEIHIFHGDRAPGDAVREGRFGPAYEEGRYTELWNLVFMQYERDAGGKLTPLARPSIDTGAGLERLATVIGGYASNYETELLAPLVALAKELAGVDPKKSLGEGEAPFRVIADHARAAAFLIADGVFPDRTRREYVLRRIMRRAIRHGTQVGLDEPFLHKVCARVVTEFGEVYPELRARAATIDELVLVEEESFRRTLDRGLRRLDAAFGGLADGATAFPPEVAADLYDTYGFPVDLTGVICREHALTLDEAAVEREVERRQASGQDAELGAGKAVEDAYFRVKEAHGATRFLGYGALEAEAVVQAILREGQPVSEASAGETVEIICDQTPFYAESGGQVGDTGELTGERLAVTVTDTRKPTELHVHHGVIEVGRVHVGQKVTLTVDKERRDAIRRNHSATHLLHHALREVLGPHVVQKGSLVAPDRLRFDFSHARPMTADQRREVELHVNRAALQNLPSSTRLMSPADARHVGAIGLFGEKYGDEVRVVTIGAESVELCGGTHVARSGDIGLFALTSEGGVAQGVRRVEAVTGMGAVAFVQERALILDGLQGELHAPDVRELPDRLDRLKGELKAREREVGELKRKLATGGGGEAGPVTVEGVKLMARVVAVSDPKALREAADTLRSRLGSGVVVLGAAREDKAVLLVAATPDLKGRVHAGKLVAALAEHVGGRGGGRPDLAQAGGPNPAGLPAAIDAAPAILEAQLRGSMAS